MRSENQARWCLLPLLLVCAMAIADGRTNVVATGAPCGTKQAKFREAVYKNAKDPEPLWRLMSALLCDSNDWVTRKQVVRASTAKMVRRAEWVEYKGEPELVPRNDELLSEITWSDDAPDALLDFPSAVKAYIGSGAENAACTGTVQADYLRSRWVITQYDIYCD